MLSPEEKTLLANIKSLVAQIEQIGGGEGFGEEDGAGASGEDAELLKALRKAMKAEQDDSTLTDEEDEEDVAKAEGAEDESEASTGDDDAEDRLEDRGTSEETAMKLVKSLMAKGVLKLNAPKSKVVEKSGRSAELRAILELTKVMKSVIGEVKMTQDAVAGILDGFGLAEEVKAVAKSQEKAKKAAKRDVSRDVILGEIRDALVGVNKSIDGKGSQKVEKSLTGVMDMLFRSR